MYWQFMNRKSIFVLQTVYLYSSLHDITCVGVVEVIGEGNVTLKPQIIKLNAEIKQLTL